MAIPNRTTQTSDLFNYYLTMNMNNICRVCLEKSNKLTQIFDPVKPPHFSILIMACAAVQVQEGDGLPPYICQRCISRLNLAFQFKTQCEASDAKLRQCFENYNLQQPPDYSGYQAKGESENGFNNENENGSENKHTQVEDSQYISEETVYSQYQGPEHREAPEIVQEGDVTLVDNFKKKKELGGFDELENAYQKTSTVAEDSTIKLEDIQIQNVTDTIPNTKKDQKPAKVHQCNTCGKIFRTKPSLVHHIRIHTGERPYVCHLCPKRFVNGGHLHTHMKTHTGEKNHICAACNKGFSTAQQLTKHTIAIHTSERPYGCTHYPKRFASSSNLSTHLKIHTGEKNFHCEICGKTFSTKGQLQQHMLVHTGEKAFLCEYCNKRFSQKAHLVRHLKTHNRTE